MSQDTLEKIKVHAYHLWEMAGKPEGKDMEFWCQAERTYRQPVQENIQPATVHDVASNGQPETKEEYKKKQKQGRGNRN